MGLWAQMSLGLTPLAVPRLRTNTQVMKTCKRFLACALCACVIVSLSTPATAAGFAMEIAPSGAAAPRNAAACINLDANQEGTFSQSSNAPVLPPSLINEPPSNETPTASEEAKHSVAVSPAPVVVPIISKHAEPSAATTPEAMPTAGPAVAGRTHHASKNSAQKQLEKLANETSTNQAKKFDGNPANPEAIDAAPDSGNPRKLGRKTAVFDDRTLKLAKYITAELPAAPPQVDFSLPVTNWGMMLNDKIGDCTVAACGHEIQQWTANASKQQTPSDDAILSAYEAVSGYRRGHPKTDKGANMLYVLKYWRKSGIADNQIGAFASMEPYNFDHVRTAVWIFGSAYLGLNMPKSAKKQDVWDVPAAGPTGDGEPGSWGGTPLKSPVSDHRDCSS